MFAEILWELGFCALLALGTPVIPLKLPFPSVSFGLCAGSRKREGCAWHGMTFDWIPAACILLHPFLATSTVITTNHDGKTVHTS
jgi:hypothetical protein